MITARHTSHRTALAALLLAAIGCGCSATRDGDPLVLREDSAGVTIVSNLAPDRPLGWTFTGVRRLGGRDEGPQSFYLLHEWTVDTDDQGRIYVLDLNNARVEVFDSTGSHLRSLGGRGAGPGELQEPVAMAVDVDGRVVVADFARTVAVSWDSEGRLQDSSLSIRPDPLTHKPFELARGELLRVDEQPGPDTDTVAWHLLGGQPEGPPIASVLRPRARPVDIGCAMGAFAPLFTPDVIWDVHDDRVAFAAGIPYLIEVVDGAGRMQVRRSNEPRQVSSAMAVQEAGSGFVAIGPQRMECSSPATLRVENQGYWPWLQAVADLELAPDGTLWVKRGGLHGEPNTIDLFRPDGEYLGTLPPDSPFPIAFLPDGRFLSLERDALDIDRIVLYHVNTQ